MKNKNKGSCEDIFKLFLAFSELAKLMGSINMIEILRTETTFWAVDAINNYFPANL